MQKRIPFDKEPAALSIIIATYKYLPIISISRQFFWIIMITLFYFHIKSKIAQNKFTL